MGYNCCDVLMRHTEAEGQWWGNTQVRKNHPQLCLSRGDSLLHWKAVLVFSWTDPQQLVYYLCPKSPSRFIRGRALTQDRARVALVQDSFWKNTGVKNHSDEIKCRHSKMTGDRRRGNGKVKQYSSGQSTRRWWAKAEGRKQYSARDHSAGT